MTTRTMRTMRAKALQTDRLICIDPGCMIVVTNEIESTLLERDMRSQLISYPWSCSDLSLYRYLHGEACLQIHMNSRIPHFTG